MSWICSRCRTRFEESLDRCPHDGKRVVVDRAGQIVAGRYAIRELLGVGGMESTVWKAWQTSTQRPVALKLLPPAEGPAAERFARGARIASNLNHPNITVVHDYGQSSRGELFLVMELLAGHTLHRVLREGAMSVERALHIADQTLRALDHAHRKHVVHRDIKPGNLFLVPHTEDDDFLKVLDFGIARFIDEDVEVSEDSSMNSIDHSDIVGEITQARQICGTPQYMAPEQLSFGAVDARTDLYALGIVMYRMLTGRLPFQSTSHQMLFRHQLHTAPPNFEEANPSVHVPPELEALVMRALAKDPAQRFASASEMRLAMRGVRGRLGLGNPDSESSLPGHYTPTPNSQSFDPTAPEEPEEAPRKKRGLWLLLLLLLLLGGGAFAYLSSETQPKEPVATRATPALKVGASPRDAVAVIRAADGGVVDATPDAAKKGHLSLGSTPSGAQVLAGAQVLGVTPLDVSMDAGTYVLSVQLARHRSETVRVELAAGGRVSQSVELRALPKASGRPPKARPAPRPRPVAARPKPRPASAKAEPKPPEPEPAGDPVEEKKPASGKVRMQLLDEGGAREFKVGEKGANPPPKPRDEPKPAIKLLD